MPLFKINSKVVLFVHIPKTGGTSIEVALHKMGPTCLHRKVQGMPTPSQHFHAELLGALIPEDFCDYAFTVCRNPYARILSEYRHQAARDKHRGETLDRWIRRALKEYGRNPYLHHNHIRPQTEFLLPRVEIFRFESGLEGPLAEVAKRCVVSQPPELSHEKSFPKEALWISRSTVGELASFYREDFTRLDYDPEDLDLFARQSVEVR